VCIAEKTAATIAALPSEAVMTRRKLIRQATQLSLSQVIENEGKEFARLVKTDTCKAIMSRFFKK
jgi:enoyl-CoA hydratase/carnithine racemase